MGQKVAGTVYIKANGVQFTVTGGVEVLLGDRKRESIAPGFFKEEDLVPFVKATIVDAPDLPIKQIMADTDATITVEFKNGRVYVLSGAYVVDEPTAKGDDGTIDIQWDGNKGGFQ